MKVQFEINKKFQEEERDVLLTGIPDAECMALYQLVLADIEEVTQITIDPSIAREHGMVAYYAGQVAALRTLLTQLKTIRVKNKTILDEDPLFS